MNYYCKYQIKENNCFPKEECKNCTADVIHNGFCDKYAPIGFKDFLHRKFTAIDSLEEKI